MNLIRRILCPLDVESPAGAALQYSFALADRFHASIDVVHACSPRHARPFESLTERLQGLMSEQRLRERLEKALSGVPSAIPGRATAHIIDGRPIEALLTHSRRNRFDLVVIGSRRSRGGTLAFPPGIGETVAHHANCAVLSLCEAPSMVSPLSIARVLLAVDFSETTDVSVNWAATLAERFGARLQLLHVKDTSGSPRAFRSLSNGGPRLRDAGDRLAEIQHRLAQRGVTVESSALREGPVPERVLEHASSAGCDLIVLGAHGGRSSVDRVVDGVIADVRRRSTVPVLSVRMSRAESLFASPACLDPSEAATERVAEAVVARLAS